MLDFAIADTFVHAAVHQYGFKKSLSGTKNYFSIKQLVLLNGQHTTGFAR